MILGYILLIQLVTKRKNFFAFALTVRISVKLFFLYFFFFKLDTVGLEQGIHINILYIVGLLGLISTSICIPCALYWMSRADSLLSTNLKWTSELAHFKQGNSTNSIPIHHKLAQREREMQRKGEIQRERETQRKGEIQRGREIFRGRENDPKREIQRESESYKGSGRDKEGGGEIQKGRERFREGGR